MEQVGNKSSSNTNDKDFNIKAGLFLAGVSAFSALIGFGTTLAVAKKQNRLPLENEAYHTIAGTNLALKALGWGSIYAFTGCGLIFYTIWKLSGAKDLQDFRLKMGSVLPRIPKTNSQGGTEIHSLQDLIKYLDSGGDVNDKKKN